MFDAFFKPCVKRRREMGDAPVPGVPLPDLWLTQTKALLKTIESTYLTMSRLRHLNAAWALAEVVLCEETRRDAEELLARLLNSPHSSCRRGGFLTVGLLGSRGRAYGNGILVQHALEADSDSEVALGALKSLGRIGFEPVLPVLNLELSRALRERRIETANNLMEAVHSFANSLSSAKQENGQLPELLELLLENVVNEAPKGSRAWKYACMVLVQWGRTSEMLVGTLRGVSPEDPVNFVFAATQLAELTGGESPMDTLAVCRKAIQVAPAIWYDVLGENSPETEAAIAAVCWLAKAKPPSVSDFLLLEAAYCENSRVMEAALMEVSPERFTSEQALPVLRKVLELCGEPHVSVVVSTRVHFEAANALASFGAEAQSELEALLAFRPYFELDRSIDEFEEVISRIEG